MLLRVAICNRNTYQLNIASNKSFVTGLEETKVLMHQTPLQRPHGAEAEKTARTRDDMHTAK